MKKESQEQSDGTKNITGYDLPDMNKYILITTILFLLWASAANAQPELVQDYTQLMEIPGISAVESSATHLYVLSESEGLIVFRAYPDSLQWLYSSTGMQRRGNRLQADVRFAYLYGEGRRLTVVEPTSVLGVYSAAILPATPVKAERIANNLYVVMDDGSLTRINLSTPENVDTDHQKIEDDKLKGKNVLDIITDFSTTLYVLTSGNSIEIYNYDENSDELAHRQTVNVNKSVTRIFYTAEDILGADESGSLFIIGNNGNTNPVLNTDNKIVKVETWNDLLVARTGNGLALGYDQEGNLFTWRNNPASGNYFTVANDKLWASYYNRFFPVNLNTSESSSNNQTDSATGQSIDKITLKPINNVTIPFPKPLIIPIEVEEKVSGDEIEFTYQSTITNASVKGNSFFWQPTATQPGRHKVTIIASTSGGLTDSTSFTVDLKPFNAPPRFTPQRPVTIPATEPFSLEIKAVDPDGLNPDLIRYMGIDLPEGSRIDEKTGRFSWTPGLQQVRTWNFRVIATDQFGAAASQNVEIKVIDLSEGEPDN